MKKQVVLTAVASLLTLASVAVLPAFALDPSTPIYKPKPRTPIERARTPTAGYQRPGDTGYGYGSGGYHDPFESARRKARCPSDGCGKVTDIIPWHPNIH